MIWLLPITKYFLTVAGDGGGIPNLAFMLPVKDCEANTNLSRTSCWWKVMFIPVGAVLCCISRIWRLVVVHNIPFGKLSSGMLKTALFPKPNSYDACVVCRILNETGCCRVDATTIKTSRDQRQTLHKWSRYILGESYIQECAKRYPKSKEYVEKTIFK